MTASNLHIAWAELFLFAARQAGVRHVVVSPGSRSTPLAIAAHQAAAHSRGELGMTVVVDERSAAFFALGQARVTGCPTVLVCTSGTAGAHYFPAIIEASHAGVPLLAVTADRPWDLQQTGASQTIDQTKLFGGFTRAFFALGLPEPHEAALRALTRVAAQAVAAARGPFPGPVHVNAPFRKPLEPAPTKAAEPWEEAVKRVVEQVPTRALSAESSAVEAYPHELVCAFTSASRGLIVCGPAPAHGDVAARRREIVALGDLLGFPVLAEATSQVRFGADADCVIGNFDALLRSRRFRADFAPDFILELGSPPTSAGYADLVADNPTCERIVVGPDGGKDPASTARFTVRADVADFCRAVRDELSSRAHLEPLHPGAAPSGRPGSDREYVERFIAADAAAGEVVESVIGASAEPGAPLTEAVVAREVVRACPPDSWLMLGNSSPVRDVDAFVPPSASPIRVLHQRGAAGIDGLVSGAAGSASASTQAVSLLLGDVSLLHDVGGLAAARGAVGPLVIVAIDNAGGRIFEQLPVHGALRPEVFEEMFATPPKVDFAAAAAAFGAPFSRARTPAELREALSAAHARRGATLVVAEVPPHDAAARNKELRARVDELFTRSLSESGKDRVA